MKRTLTTLVKIVSYLSVMVACLFAGQAKAQIVVNFPPPAFIATATPVYFEGHPAYWYNNRWCYRDGRGAWAYYHEEPAYLHDWRGHHEFERRRVYEERHWRRR
jgi:hypothetical protein